MKYYVKHNNEELGPYRLDDIESMLKKELLPRFIKIKGEFEDEWKSLNDYTQHINLNNSEETLTNSVFKNLKNKKEASKIFIKKQDNDESELVSSADLNKTIISVDTQKELLRKTEKIKKNIDNTFKQLQNKKSSIDKTKFYDLEEFQDALIEAEETEDLLRKKRRDVDEVKKAAKDPVNRTLFLAILLCMLGFLFIDTEEKKIEEVIKEEFYYPQITDIQEVVNGNIDKSNSIASRAKKFSFYKYEDLIRKSEVYKESLDYFYNKDSILNLAKTYSLLLPFSKEKSKDANVIDSLLDVLGEDKIYKQPMNFEAWVIFYHNIGKHAAVKFLVNNYFKISKKVTALTLSFYFRSLQILGNYEEIDEIKDQVIKSRKESAYAYTSLLEYLLMENRFREYGDVFRDAYKNYPDSLEILRHGVKFYILEKSYDKAFDLLKNFKKREFDHHQKYKAFYLESMGVISAMNGSFKDAKKYFDSAIALNPESEIVTSLSDLDVSDKYSETSKLINRSKSIDSIRKSKKYIKEKKFEQSLSAAIDAVDSHASRESKLNLAEIQKKLGFYGEAIKNFEKVQREEKGLGGQSINLLSTYVDSYQFKKANELISKINTMPLSSNSRYKEVVADYHFKQEKYAKALYWLNLSIKENRINDNVHYKISQIRFDNGHIREAKERILDAIKYDPSNIDYRILYAKIIKEQDGVETAIGYLRSIKKKFIESTKINNQIAIFYYESGQISSFEDLVKKVVIDDKENEDFYLFMMNAASMDENDETAIEYAKKYILVNPANHEVGVELAKAYMRLLKFEDAEKTLLRIHSRISSFPEVNSLLAQIYKNKGNLDKAEEYAKAEIESNSRVTYGYVELAKIMIKKENYGGAALQLEKAKRYDSEDMEMLKTFARLKARSGQLPDAAKLFEKALEVDGDEHFLYFELGEVYKNMGKSKEAVVKYKAYLELFPDAPEKDEILSFLKLVE